jgi:hypothetical protein
MISVRGADVPAWTQPVAGSANLLADNLPQKA